MPEQGYYEFPTKREANNFIKSLCTDKLVQREDLTVEEFDRITSDALTLWYSSRTSPEFKEYVN